jgi:hypothetical protein
MIPKEIMAMAREYPGSPVTTAIIERLLKTRIPPEDNTAGKLVPWMEAREKDMPEIPVLGSGRTQSIPTFSGDDIEMDSTGLITVRYRSDIDFHVSARVFLSSQAFGGNTLAVSDLAPSFETRDDLVQALQDILLGNHPRMDPDYSEADTGDLPDWVEIDWETAAISSEGEVDTDCTTECELENLADHLVDCGIIELTDEEED